eukprot:Rmarinus@m.17739
MQYDTVRRLSSCQPLSCAGLLLDLLCARNRVAFVWELLGYTTTTTTTTILLLLIIIILTIIIIIYIYNILYILVNIRGGCDLVSRLRKDSVSYVLHFHFFTEQLPGPRSLGPRNH